MVNTKRGKAVAVIGTSGQIMTNLVLAQGSTVIVTGLMGAPELNGQRGIVEGWIEERGRHTVRLEDKRRKKAANLRPENCRADVLAL